MWTEIIKNNASYTDQKPNIIVMIKNDGFPPYFY